MGRLFRQFRSGDGTERGQEAVILGDGLTLRKNREQEFLAAGQDGAQGVVPAKRGTLVAQPTRPAGLGPDLSSRRQGIAEIA
ncbi:hypothetical protein [Bosea sp. 124]|uniref:hypothetical protein n=1 Tax=Bosea sp. 124 TaxID=2135642 RepID=UPI000D35CEDE|nr:hypothetical protein [Bosea sp. 124]